MTTGTEGNDNLVNDRTLRNETIDALGGDDIITVTAPFSTIQSNETVTVNGGSGFDTLILDTGYAYGFASATGFDGHVRIRQGSGIGWDVYWTSIERLELTVKLFNGDLSLGDEVDILKVDLGFGGQTGTVTTGAGNDEIYAKGSSGAPFHADGGAGNDLIDMTAINGNAIGLYTAVGGTGDDVIKGSNYDDLLDGGAGDDVLNGNDVQIGIGENQYIGGSGNDIITGWGGNTIDWVRYDLETGGGAVFVNLSDSQVTLGGVLLDPGTAHDTFGDTDSLIAIDRISGNSGADHMLGSAGANYFDGGAGADSLSGAGGNDTLLGGAGADTLVGGAGTDTLSGGEGADNLIGGEQAGGDGEIDWVDYSLETGVVSGAAVNLSGASAVVGGILLAPNTARDTYGTIDTLTGIEYVRGSASDDHVLGSDSGERVDGSFGGDLLEGKGGNDILNGDDGNDILDGGTGADAMSGGEGSDVYYVDNAGDTVTEPFGSVGTDEVRTSLASYSLATLASGGPVENLTGTASTGQTLTGNDLGNVILGGGGADTLIGNGGTDRLAGGLGNDILNGGYQDGSDGADDWAAYDLETGGGSVAVNLSAAAAMVGGTLLAANTARDTYGTIDTLVGIEFASSGAGNDSMLGGSGVNRFETGAGNDILDGGAGADILVGGTGDDIYYVDNAADTVTENAGEGVDEVRTSLLTYSLASRPNVENLTATNDVAHDFRGNSGNNVIIGGAGSDTMKLYDVGTDTVHGGAGDDLFFFGASIDSSDVIDGGANTDTLIIQGNYAGGLTLTANVTNIENLSILNGANTSIGAPGTDLYDYVITTNDANFAAGLQVRVNAGALLPGEDFTFNGSNETDASFVIYGGRGVDTLTGGLGNDIFFFAEQLQFAPGDTVNGGAGYDSVYFRGNYTIDFNAPGYAGQFNSIESMTLTSASDTRYARGGPSEFDYSITLADANLAAGVTLTINGTLLQSFETMVVDGSQETDGFLRIFAGSSDDTIKGGGQADLIHGNFGADTLTGGGGADTFRYQKSGESTASSMDHILDFTPGTDKIELTRMDADTNVDGNQAFHWIDSNAFTGAGASSAGELRAYEQSGTWYVEGDTNGDGSGDFLIALTLQGATPLSQNDFFL
ncbi:MAG: M10 family metallopeptidase C-terminal domain-containing protein [Allosphingosinicella sp.]